MCHYRIVDAEAFEQATTPADDGAGKHRTVECGSVVSIYLDGECREIGRKLRVFVTGQEADEITYYLRCEKHVQPCLPPLFTD